MDVEKLNEAIEEVLSNTSNDSVSTILNKIIDKYGNPISFAETTEIAKLIEPQLKNRNVLKLLMLSKETEK